MLVEEIQLMKILIQILKNNNIKAAILDVTRDEPLKKDSALWSLKCCFTQHTGGGSESEIKEKIDFFLNNLKKFKNNKKKLLNKVNLSKGY